MLLLLLWLGPAADGQTILKRQDYAEVHMGVRTTFSFYSPSSDLGEKAARAAYDRIAELENVASDYRPASEVRRLAARLHIGRTKVSPDLWRLLLRSQEAAEASGGAFDITAGPFISLWREARRTGRLPAWKRFREAKALVGWQSLRLDPQGREVWADKEGLQLDLGGIAKGDAIDQALTVFRRFGISRVLIQMGGDMGALDAPPGQRGWRIEAEAAPSGEIWLRNSCLSTSGDAEQFVDVGGKRYSHIVDPRTGFGVTTRIQATVLAKKGLTTDPLSTALCVLGAERGRALARQWGARAWFLSAPSP
jgi:FAD:protein FMN transferase